MRKMLHPALIFFPVASFLFAGQQGSPEDPPRPQKRATDADTRFIFLLHDGIQLERMMHYADQYKRWAAPGVTILFRIQAPRTLLDRTIRLCEDKGYPYVYTAASSDYWSFPQQFHWPKKMYRDLKREVFPVLSRKLCRGIYLHELFAQRATVLKNWDPKQLAESSSGLDWDWLDDLLRETARQNKTVYWSDGGLSWQMPFVSSNVHQRFLAWGRNVVPLFAVNFLQTYETNGDWAAKLASRYGTTVGISIQDWHFVAQQRSAAKGEIVESVTEDNTIELCRLGLARGARTYQIEATQEGMAPTSPFMKGIRRFIRDLSHSPTNSVREAQ